MTKTTQTSKTNNAQALLATLRAVVTLDRMPVPELTAPTLPASYAEVKSGLSSMAERFVDPARAGAAKTGVDDVYRELVEVLASASRRGFPFESLGAALEYDEALALHRSQQAQYIAASSEKAGKIADAIRVWLADLAAVLTVRDRLGEDAVADAATANNKTMAATALDLIARERLTSGGAADLPVLAAGRGLMTLRDAGVEALTLCADDLLQVAAEAGSTIYPLSLPGYGLAASSLEFRVGSSLVKIDQRAAVLYREAEANGGRSMLPQTVLVATSKTAAHEVQASIDERLSRVQHVFIETASASVMPDERGADALAFARSIG
ncbi:hypothetical protein PQS90_05020 [Pseudomonas sp. BLCC-B13]|uniref:hypothetical protein n=1 Tax=Pseudomonas sp. BLCC-B13 TaxID=3025314 RepID=UPI00234F9363|nr:hypothetical protein [Pseudomonas sp. BLCC-B13]MDC7824508.1 hypothetical protein [Pseudomonas sp. BLCC-B13]